MEKKEVLQYFVENYTILNLYDIKSFNIKEEEKKIEVYKYLKDNIKDLDLSSTYNFLDKFKLEIEKTQKEFNKAKNIERKKKRAAELKLDEERAEKFMKIVKPGMIIHVKGTNDMRGFRLVLKCNKIDLDCQKLNKISDKNLSTRFRYKKSPYLTTHYWTKVTKILEETFKE